MPSSELTAVDASTGVCLDLSSGRRWQIKNFPDNTYIADSATTADGRIYLALGARTWKTGNGSWSLATLDAETSELTRLPWLPDSSFPVSLTAADSRLLVGLAASPRPGKDTSEGGVCEIDCSSARIRWLYRPSPRDSFSPAGLAVGVNTTYFVDTGNHALYALAGAGLRLVAGHPGSPGRGPDRLNSPSGVSAQNGLLYVSDSRNGRVQVFDEDGVLRTTIGATASESVRRLKDPRSVRPSSAGTIVIADPGYRAVTRWSVNPVVEIQRWGPEPPTGINLSFPRSVDVSRRSLWIADSNNDRILRVQQDSSRGYTAIDCTTGKGLSWPRSARWNPSQSQMSVSDGLNHRVVLLDESGGVASELDSTSLGLPMSDPHDARWLSDTELLITDSGTATVTLVDLVRGVRWSSSELIDPHHATVHQDTVLVADPEMSAIVVIDSATGEQKRIVDGLTTLDGKFVPLVRPRTCWAARHGLVIADETGAVHFTDRALQLICTWDGRYRLDDHTEQLRAPRDISVIGSTLVATDYRNDVVILIELASILRRARASS
ncbi:hypothetical protein ACIA8C_22950 [Nocardia sp. NPDC051321]|uniref:hypothetical protein n=1 Tax=Nocardia sp. NPDC051321 TaxID=3364323 RepID=UPI00379BCE80